MVVVMVDGWPTDKVEEASRLARESGINIFFVTIEAAAESEKQSIIEPNFVDKVFTGLGSGQDIGFDYILQAVSFRAFPFPSCHLRLFLVLLILSCGLLYKEPGSNAEVRKGTKSVKVWFEVHHGASGFLLTKHWHKLAFVMRQEVFQIHRRMTKHNCSLSFLQASCCASPTRQRLRSPVNLMSMLHLQTGPIHANLGTPPTQAHPSCSAILDNSNILFPLLF